MLWLPRHGPWGGGVGPAPPVLRRSPPPPRAPPPEGWGWGWGLTDVQCSPPPPPLGGGSMPCPVADGPARAAVSRREMSPKISASPREGGGGCGRG